MSIEKKEFVNIIFFFIGKLVSLFGSSIYTFAIGLYTLKITGSGLTFATTLVLGTLPAILINPFAGVLADRIDKKKLVIFMDFLNAALFIIFYVISLSSLTLPIIYLCTLVTTILTNIFDITLEAAKPDIVSEERLMSINSIGKIVDSAPSILGPMIGGLIFALLDIKVIILINGISFVLSAVSELFMDFKLNKKDVLPTEKMNFIVDIKEGFTYIISQKNILNLFYIFIIINLFLSLAISVPMPFIINNVLNLGTHYYGIIEGTFSIGMIIGAVFVKKVYEKIPYNRLLIMMSFILSLCMILTGIIVFPAIAPMPKSVYFIYYSIIMTILGISISFIDIPIFFILQNIIPENLRGRVLSIGLSTVKFAAPAALILSGFLINHISPYILPVTGGIALFASMLMVTKI